MARIIIAAVVVLSLLRTARSCWKTLPWHGRPASGPSVERLEHLASARARLGEVERAGFLADGDFGGPFPGMDAYATQYAVLPILLRSPAPGDLVVATLRRAASVQSALTAGYEVVADLGDGVWVLRRAP